MEQRTRKFEKILTHICQQRAKEPGRPERSGKPTIRRFISK